MLTEWFRRNGKEYRKALVIGIGGGNDMFSASLVAAYLLDIGIETDVAGVLSPMAIHTFKGKIENPVNRIRGTVERFIHAPQPVRIPFVDGSAPKFFRHAGIRVGKFLDLSIRFGTEKLTRSMESLIETEGYDFIVAVDVGGDVLARGKEDPMLLTPLADFALLNVINRLPVDSVLVEIGLGTDGELRQDGMVEILAEIRRSGMLISEHRLRPDDPGTIAFRKLYKKVSAIRKGNTMGRLIQTMESDRDIPILHRHHSQIGGRSWNVHYESVIPSVYAGKVYVIDLKMLAESRSEMAFAFRNPLEQYVRMKRIAPEWATEIDLGFLFCDRDWTSPHRNGYSLHLLVPSVRIPYETRMEIIAHGIRNAEADFILITDDDMRSVSRRMPLGGYFHVAAGGFMVLSRRSDEREFAEEIAKQICEYGA
ncbi:MAG: DUF1152 domain-containing protein [Candidatus Moranbacteria bacterium]|nr:DUF1152 domain-containing protein [Candidatus Moranbacteria bacterium]